MEKATCNTIQCDELLEAKAAVAENSLETTILASGRERRVTDAETFGSSCSANPQTSARVESYGLSPIQKGCCFIISMRAIQASTSSKSSVLSMKRYTKKRLSALGKA
jgi:hypothetical protein